MPRRIRRRRRTRRPLRRKSPIRRKSPNIRLKRRRTKSFRTTLPSPRRKRRPLPPPRRKPLNSPNRRFPSRRMNSMTSSSGARWSSRRAFLPPTSAAAALPSSGRRWRARMPTPSTTSPRGAANIRSLGRAAAQPIPPPPRAWARSTTTVFRRCMSWADSRSVRARSRCPSRISRWATL